MRFVLAVIFASWLVLPAFASEEVPEQQTVTAIEPQAEQRVEPIEAPPEQHVEAVEAGSEQEVSGGHKSVARRSAETAGKVALGILAAGVSLGVMVAELLLI